MKSAVVTLLLASCHAIHITSISNSQGMPGMGTEAPAAGPPATAKAKGAKDTRYVPYVYGGLDGFAIGTLEHCPDFNERMTLVNGKTKAVAYPKAGFNCNADYGLSQGMPGMGSDAPAAGPPATAKTVVETRYIPYSYGGLDGFAIGTLEHCPDFNERMTLINGKTKAVAYPKAGFNCNADYGLTQGMPGMGGPPATAKAKVVVETRYEPYTYPGLDGFAIGTLEHCPDFNERMTLINGKTKAVAYPKAGFNCNADYGLAQKVLSPAAAAAKAGKNELYVPYAYPGLTGFDISAIEHCPDFNERKSLLDGVTPAVSYPKPGFNCNADYGLHKKNTNQKNII